MEPELKEHRLKELWAIVSTIKRIDDDMHLGISIWAFTGILQKLYRMDDERVFNESYLKVLHTLVGIVISIGDLSSYIYKQNCQLAEQVDLSREKQNIADLNFQMENFIF